MVHILTRAVLGMIDVGCWAESTERNTGAEQRNEIWDFVSVLE